MIAESRSAAASIPFPNRFCNQCTSHKGGLAVAIFSTLRPLRRTTTLGGLLGAKARVPAHVHSQEVAARNVPLHSWVLAIVRVAVGHNRTGRLTSPSPSSMQLLVDNAAVVHADREDAAHSGQLRDPLLHRLWHSGMPHLPLSAAPPGCLHVGNACCVLHVVQSTSCAKRVVFTSAACIVACKALMTCVSCASCRAYISWCACIGAVPEGDREERVPSTALGALHHHRRRVRDPVRQSLARAWVFILKALTLRRQLDTLSGVWPGACPP